MGYILLVSDDPRVREIFTFLLQLESLFEVHARDEEGALAHISCRKPKLITTDSQMSCMDEMALLGRVIGLGLRIQCVVTRASRNNDQALNDTKPGVVSRLDKPCDREELKAKISTTLALKEKLPQLPVSQRDETGRITTQKGEESCDN